MLDTFDMMWTKYVFAPKCAFMMYSLVQGIVMVV